MGDEHEAIEPEFDGTDESGAGNGRDGLPHDAPPPLPSGESAGDLSAGTHRLADDDKLWVLGAHLSWLVGLGIVGPLVVWLVNKDKGPEKHFVVEHALEAFNFQITSFAASMCAAIAGVFLCGFPYLLIPVIMIGSIVFSILAAMKGSEGKPYRYPLTVRLINP